ncbi:MAG: HD domain-containing protein [Trueperaceae bacterium]|nr:HD domain-containing protein [Trueperaceae bacterium]
MSALAYLLNAYRLKDRPRTGWVLRGIDRPESVAGHTWGTALLCMLFADDAGVDRAEALEIALTHDLAEAEIGDLPSLADPALRPVAADQKARLEARAMAALHESWPGPAADLVARRWRSYEDRDGPAARFVRDMNLLDMALQALIYEREGRYGPRANLGAGSGAAEGGGPGAAPGDDRGPDRGDERVDERSPPEAPARLDEFFASAEARVTTPFGRARLAEIADAYRELRPGCDDP